jgi:hypothetical protein
VWLDLQVLRRGKVTEPDLLLASEAGGLNGIAALGRYALMRVPWTTLVTLQYIRLRRAALFASADSEAASAEPALTLVRETRAKMDIASTATAWDGVGVRASSSEPVGGEPRRSWIRRYRPLLVWLVLLTPPLIYYVIGTTPAMAGVQDLLAFRWVFPVLVVTMVGGLVWIGWQIVWAVRHLPGALRQALGDVIARVEFRIATGAGAAGIGALSLYSWLMGTQPEHSMVLNLHVLDALSDLLLVGGIALMLAAIIYYPPVGLVGLAGRGVVLVPTVTSGYLTWSTLGVAGIALSHAAGPVGDAEGGGSGGGGGGVPPRLTARGIAENPQAARGRPPAEVEQGLDDLLNQPGWTKMPVRKGEGTRWVQTKPNTGRSFSIERQPQVDDPLHQGWYLKIADRGTVTRVPLEGNPVLP